MKRLLVLLLVAFLGFPGIAFAECAAGYTQITVPLCKQTSSNFNVGYTTIPTAGSGNSYTAGFNFANGPYTMPQTGTIQSCSVWLASGPSGSMQCGVYSAVSSSQPGTLLAASASFTPIAGWNTVATTSHPSVTGGTSIFMGAFDTVNNQTLADSNAGFNLYGDNGGETTLQTTFLNPAHLDASAFQLGAYATFSGGSLAPAFYVAITGSDSNAGTLAAPFATLGKCQTAMQGSSTQKTCYIRAGSYTPAGLSACNSRGNCAVGLSSPSDNGETWSYYPPDGVDSASITGGSTASGNGLWAMFYTGNASHVTINGLSMHNFDCAAIASTGDDPAFLTVTNNLLFNGFGIVGDASLSGAQSAGGFMCYDCTNLTVTHNVVHDIASFGITNDYSAGSISNYLVDSNVLYTICTAIRDCGAIYSQDLSSASTNLKITNNYVRDGAVFDTAGWGAGVYLDDCTNNYVVSGNVLTGENGGNNVMIHGGSNNAFSDNLTDISTFGGTNTILRLQSSSCATPTGNSFQGDIIISNGGGGGYNGISGTVTVQNNAYHNYGSGTLSTSGDSSPVVEDPQLTGWGYTIASGSPVFNSPVRFTDFIRGWGPPGFIVPQTGTAPSSPH